MLLGLTYLEAVDNLIYVSLLENVSIASRLCLLSPHHFFSSLNHKGPNYRLSKKGERIKAAAEKSHENCVVFKRDEAVFVFHAMVASSQDKCDLVVKKKFSI